MKNITVLIPLVKDYDKDLLGKALKSIPKSIKNILLIAPETVEVDDKLLNKNTQLIKNNTGKNDFASQINLGVLNVKTEYFSVLEYDDEYSNIFFKNFEKFREGGFDASFYLPVIAEVKDGQFVRITNEFVWSKSFIEDDNFGYLTNKQLQDYSYFYLSGGIFNVNDFNEINGLKPEFDITCVYEFLLRATFNNKKVFVIPKIGYLHQVDREGSATKMFSVKYTKEEVEKQYSKAKTEYML